MKATVSRPEPQLLIDMRLGDLFASDSPEHRELVMALVDECVMRPDAHNYDEQSGALQSYMRSAPIDTVHEVVVIACRVANGEPGYAPTGLVFQLRGDHPVTRLEQIEPLALRAAEIGRPIRVSPRVSVFPLTRPETSFGVADCPGMEALRHAGF